MTSVLAWSNRGWTEVESEACMLSVTVNGVKHEVPQGERSLLSYLRFDLGLTGAKYGGSEGLCGACTVIVDGRSVPA